MNKEGPSVKNIPSRSYSSCYGCKFYSHRMWRSGKNPKYRHNCNHEESRQSGILGNLQDDKTPDWCPIETKK